MARCTVTFLKVSAAYRLRLVVPRPCARVCVPFLVCPVHFSLEHHFPSQTCLLLLSPFHPCKAAFALATPHGRGTNHNNIFFSCGASPSLSRPHSAPSIVVTCNKWLDSPPSSSILVPRSLLRWKVLLTLIAIVAAAVLLFFFSKERGQGLVRLRMRRRRNFLPGIHSDRPSLSLSLSLSQCELRIINAFIMR